MKYCCKEDDVFYHTLMTITRQKQVQIQKQIQKKSKKTGLMYTGLTTLCSCIKAEMGLVYDTYSPLQYHIFSFLQMFVFVYLTQVWSGSFTLISFFLHHHHCCDSHNYNLVWYRQKPQWCIFGFIWCAQTQLKLSYYWTSDNSSSYCKIGRNKFGYLLTPCTILEIQVLWFWYHWHSLYMNVRIHLAQDSRSDFKNHFWE